MPVVGQLIRVRNTKSSMVQRDITAHGELWIVITPMPGVFSVTAKALTSGKVQIFAEGEWEEEPGD